MYNPVLVRAAVAHREQNPGHEVMVGLNFIECFTCGAHAHLSTDGKTLIAHGVAGEGLVTSYRSGRYHTLARPEEFAFEPTNLVDPGEQCPDCDECRVDFLIWLDEETVECQTCGRQYSP